MRTYIIEYAVYRPGSFTCDRAQERVTANDSAAARAMITCRFPQPLRCDIISYKEV
jgi:hypothetical protein